MLANDKRRRQPEATTVLLLCIEGRALLRSSYGPVFCDREGRFGKACVHRIVTNLGVFDVVPGGLKLIEIAPGVAREEIVAKTEATLV